MYESARGITDDAILDKAFNEKWILITNDKDFGEKIFRERRPHHGVILLRLDNERSSNKIETLRRLLEAYTDQLTDRFVVVTEARVRFASTSSE